MVPIKPSSVTLLMIAVILAGLVIVPAPRAYAGAADEMEILPANPTSLDLVELRVWLWETNYSYLARMEREDRVITLHFRDSCITLCPEAHPAEHRVPFGRLEPGNWHIVAYMRRDSPGEWLVGTLDFTVAAPADRAALELHPATPSRDDLVDLQVLYRTLPCQGLPFLNPIERVGPNLLVGPEDGLFKLTLTLGEIAPSCADDAVQRGSFLAELGELTPGNYRAELWGDPGGGEEPSLIQGLDFTVAPAESALLQGRFEASLTWKTPNGETGTAKPVAGGSRESALFSFFAAENWEVMVKVLDGCAINGHFWVFLAAATDVEFTLTVEDRTGHQQPYTYFSPAGLFTLPLGDTAAFSCNP